MPTAAELLAATESEAPPALRTTEKAAAGQPKGGGLAAFGAAMGLTEAPDARALRDAADAEPGVRSRSCLIRTDDDTGETTVTMSVAIAYGLALHAVAERVRERVAAAAVDVLGVAPLPKRADGKAAKKTAAAAKSSAARTAKSKSAAKTGAEGGALRVDVKVVWLDEPAPEAAPEPKPGPKPGSKAGSKANPKADPTAGPKSGSKPKP